MRCRTLPARHRSPEGGNRQCGGRSGDKVGLLYAIAIWRALMDSPPYTQQLPLNEGVCCHRMSSALLLPIVIPQWAGRMTDVASLSRQTNPRFSYPADLAG